MLDVLHWAGRLRIVMCCKVFLAIFGSDSKFLGMLPDQKREPSIASLVVRLWSVEVEQVCHCWMATDVLNSSKWFGQTEEREV